MDDDLSHYMKAVSRLSSVVDNLGAHLSLAVGMLNNVVSEGYWFPGDDDLARIQRCVDALIDAHDPSLTGKSAAEQDPPTTVSP